MNITWPQRRLSNRQLAAIPLAIIAILTISMLVLSVPFSTDFRESGLIRVRGLENVPDAGAVEIAVENLLNYNADVDISIVVEQIFDGNFNRASVRNIFQPPHYYQTTFPEISAEWDTEH